MLDLFRMGRALLAGAGLVVLVSACTLSSEQLLLSEGELVTPLPAQFAMAGYEEGDAPGVYVRGDEAPERMERDGTAYVDETGETQARFAPLGDGTYLIAVTGDGSTLYGVAEYENDVLALHLLIENAEQLDGVLAEARRTGDAGTLAALDDMTIDEGGLLFNTRAALDLAIGWMKDGTLQTIPMVSHVAADAASPQPARIIRENGRWSGAD